MLALMDMQLTWQRSAMAMFWPWCLKDHLVDIKGHPTFYWSETSYSFAHELFSMAEYWYVLSMTFMKLYSVLLHEAGDF